MIPETLLCPRYSMQAESPLLPGQDTTICRPRRSSSLSINLQQRKQQLTAAIESFTLDEDFKKKKTNGKMDQSKVDDAVGKVTGEWGKWQLRTVLLIFLCKIPSSWFMACIIFTAPAPRHGEFYCKPPDTLPINNHTLWIKISHPEKEEKNDEEFTIDFCNVYQDAREHVQQYFHYNLKPSESLAAPSATFSISSSSSSSSSSASLLSSIDTTMEKDKNEVAAATAEDNNYTPSSSSSSSLLASEAVTARPWEEPKLNTSAIVPCTEFEHKSDYHSLITQFDLVCSRDILVAVTQFFHLFGVLTGGLLATQLLKYFSPRNVMMFGMLSQIFCGNMTGHVISYELHVFFRCLSAVCCAQMYTAGAMIFMDITGGKPRTIVITLFEQFWSIGVILLPGVASFFTSWTHLYMAISFPTFILVYLWRWIPDSPRWMITRGRVDEAKEILMQCIEYNGTKYGLPSDIDHQLQLQAIACMESPPPAGWSSLWSGPKAIRHMICVHLCWSIYIVVYYGMLLNIRSFSREHLEINTAIAGACEIIGVFIGLYFILNTTRKWLWTGLFNIIAGLICYLAWIIPPEIKGNNRVALLMLSAMVSKSAISSTLAILTTCTTELVSDDKKRICAFSTIVWARIWLLCAPFIGATVIFGQLIPQTAFASLSIIGGVLTTLISSPRTIPKKKKTPTSTSTSTINLPPELIPGIWTTKNHDHNHHIINRV